MTGRFRPGDHLQIQRPRLYFHHGIYVSDDRVIQFGSGVALRNKGGIGISALTLEDFEQGGRATVVRHGYESWFTGHHPSADEPWKVIERAEFLLKRQPALKYNLIGHNCEIVANMLLAATLFAHESALFGVHVSAALDGAAGCGQPGRRAEASSACV